MWIKRLFYFVLLLILLLTLGIWLYSRSLQTTYAEDIKLDGLQEKVEVYFDKYAIPHIYAKNIDDVYFMIGYIQAKERLFQIELVRRLAGGRLSEIFGSAALDSDKFMRTIGIADYSQKSLADFEAIQDPEVKSVVQSYINGINTWLEHGSTPLEFTALGIPKEEFTVTDVNNIMGYMAISFAMAHRTEPVLDYLLNTFGPEYLADLDVHVDPSTTIIPSQSASSDLRDLSVHIDHMLKDMPIPQLIGSNSWVVSPDKSSSGQVLFANDPHIGFSQPAIWYEVHWETPLAESYSYLLPGYPMAQLTHNRHHAIGLTMFENDDMDLYREKQNPNNENQYWHIDQWKDYEHRIEIIKIKGQKDLELDVKETVHGPIINGLFEDIAGDEPVSMYWVYTKFANHLLESSYQVATAKSMEEVAQGAALAHAPGVNIMYGDVDGNIAWWASAKLPKRAEHINSKLILDGASGKDDILDYWSFEDNPQNINPASNYVYSANNQPASKDSSLYPGYYLPEDRAKRITTLLDAKDKWSVDDYKNMLLDDTSSNATTIVSSIDSILSSASLSEKQHSILDLLNQWDGSFDQDQVAPTIYIKLVYHILQLGMADEIGESFESFTSTHILKRSIQNLLNNPNSKWWDNHETIAVEHAQDIFTQALSKTITELTAQLGEEPKYWKWGKVHTLTHDHAMSQNEALAPYFSVGPYEVSGTNEVINNMLFGLNAEGTYKVKGGPSTRRIIDFSDIENNSWSILPTGQSGNPLSPHYKDQADMFAKGKFRKMLMYKPEIMKTAKYISRYEPGK